MDRSLLDWSLPSKIKSVKLESGSWVSTQHTMRAENCQIGLTFEQGSEEISKMEYFLPIWIQNLEKTMPWIKIMTKMTHSYLKIKKEMESKHSSVKSKRCNSTQ